MLLASDCAAPVLGPPHDDDLVHVCTLQKRIASELEAVADLQQHIGETLTELSSVHGNIESIVDEVKTNLGDITALLRDRGSALPRQTSCPTPGDAESSRPSANGTRACSDLGGITALLRDRGSALPRQTSAESSRPSADGTRACSDLGGITALLRDRGRALPRQTNFPAPRDAESNRPSADGTHICSEPELGDAAGAGARAARREHRGAPGAGEGPLEAHIGALPRQAAEHWHSSEPWGAAPSEPASWPVSPQGTWGAGLVPGLPLSWPDIQQRSHAPAVNCESSGRLSPSYGRSKTLISGVSDHDSRRGAANYCMVDPNSTIHMCFGICSVLILLYDLNVVPYVLAWDVAYVGWLNVVAYATCCFWTLDIVMSFCTGFYAHGELVIEPRLVARHYKQTWFMPDLAVVLCDWLSMVIFAVSDSDDNSAGIRMLRFAKMGKILRIMGMLRMVKLARFVEDYVERNLSEQYRLSLRLTSLLLLTLWLNHLVCCTWFAIGHSGPSDTGLRWVQASRMVGDIELSYEGQNPVYEYLTAYHWSASQVTLGAIEIPCNNSLERVFNIICLLLGLLFSSTLVSSLSATMMEFQMAKKDKLDKLRTLRRYLRENAVDRRVAMLVQHQAIERLERVDKLADSQVAALNLISSSLRAELRFEIIRPYFISHPLFRLWANRIQHLCAECVDISLTVPHDDVFVAGNATDRAYFVVSGRLVYTQVPESSAVRATTETVVLANRWLCEAALWSHWVHVGTLEAQTMCKLLVVPAEGVTQTMLKHGGIRDVTLQYGENFHRRIVSSRPPETTYPNDLEVPFTDYGDIVISMSVEAQKLIGLDALEQVAASRSWHHRKISSGLEKLREEVVRGKSTVMLNNQGEIERVVSVIALRIQDEGGRIFVQIGKKEEAHVAPACQLPGGKRERDELTADTVRRLFATKLEPLTDATKIICTERSTQWKNSREYGINTKYLKTVCIAKLLRPFKASVCAASQASLQGLAARTRHPGLFDREVYNIPDKSKEAYFVWLTQEEFDDLSQPANEAVLSAWLSALDHKDHKNVTCSGHNTVHV